MKKLSIIAILVLFLFTLSGCGKPVKVYPAFTGDVRMWENMLTASEPFEFEDMPLGVIMPHHLIAGDVIAQMYDGMSKVGNPSTVFVIGPNHFDAGDAYIQTCKECVFKTTVGDLEVEKDLVSSLIKSDVAVQQDDSFPKEHAIHSHVTYIRENFPDAEIVPIILKWGTPTNKLDKLINWLNANAPEDSLIVASVDFSHYIPLEFADFHDTASKATILNFDYNNIDDLEIDSPASIYTILHFLEKRGYTDGKQFAHTNLQNYMTTHTEETTSHQFFGFFENEDEEVEPYKSASILSVGDLPAEHDLNFMDSWQWDPSYDETNDHSTTKQLRDIRGTEDRLLQGADYYAFDMDDNACRTENQNGMKVAFCKFVEGTYDDDEFNKTLDDIDNESDLVYLLYEWDDGKWTSKKERFVKKLTDDIDIFVGRGLDEMVPMHVYRHSLLFYSLGDFIVDNKLITDLNSESDGMMIGINATEEDFKVFFLPVDVVNGYPKLKDFSERAGVVKDYTSDINLNYTDDLDSVYGIMLIER